MAMSDMYCPPNLLNILGGAQGHSSRVLNLRLRGRGFEPYRRHCVVSLSKNFNPSLVLVQSRKTRPFITERLLMGCKESNQTKQRISKGNIFSVSFNSSYRCFHSHFDEHCLQGNLNYQIVSSDGQKCSNKFLTHRLGNTGIGMLLSCQPRVKVT